MMAALVAATMACSSDKRDGTSGGGDGDADTDTDTGLDCDPGEIWCYEGWVAECNEAGDDWELIEDCEEQGLVCAAGECTDTSMECAAAINEKSYVGCDYWPVTLANATDDEGAGFFFAVAVANAGMGTAEVTITDGASINNSYSVDAGQMVVIDDLPWKLDLKEPGDFISANWATRQVTNGAYHLTSTLPVTVYQFSPLEYESTGIFSYTNDASLLLPSHVYRDEYIVMSRPTLKIDGMGSDPGLFAVVGVGEEATTVEITLNGNTCASDATSSVSYPAHGVGDVIEVTLQPHEVLQMLAATETGCTGATDCMGSMCCNTPPEYDLTGSVIRVVDGPNPAVFGGSECSFVPFNKWACDHLEEQLFPRETWGTHYLAAHNATQAPGEPTIWRVLSGNDGNEISFNPSSVYGTVTLNKGEYIEFESLADFEITGSGRILLAQFMVGQNYTSDTAAPENGDPAMALAVPVEQYRTEYTFLAPTTYVHNYLTVIHPTGNYPSVDGTPVAGETVEIAGGYSRTNVEISGGIHQITAGEPFAIMVYGVGSYTSYIYAGGLDLKKVDVDVE
jgi:hypothetical protein